MELRRGIQISMERIFYSVILVFILFIGIAIQAEQTFYRKHHHHPRRGLGAHQKDKINKFINSVLECRNVPGVGLSVVTSKRVLLQRGYGMVDVENREPVTAHSLFPIASNTKAFTSTLLAMLLEKDNKTTWDTSIKDILGEGFELYNDLLTQHVTLRDLLAHKTGVPDYFLPLMAVFPENETRENMVWRLRYHKPIYPFRTKFRYNNYMYMLAGYVAEVLGGGSWEELVRRLILKPLGMASTTFIRHLEDWDKLARSYVELENGKLQQVEKVLIKQTHAADPAGSILSTASDVTRWLQFHLRRGALEDGRPLLSPGGLAETYSAEMPSPLPMANRDLLRPTYPVDDVHLAYNMGWMTNVYRGYKRIWHSGGVTTYKSQIWTFPELDLGLFIVCNGPPKGTTTWALINILQYITDVITGNAPWLNSTSACTFPEPWGSIRESSTIMLADDNLPENIKDFVGTFNHPGFGDLNISHEPGSNRLYMRMGQFFTAALLYNETEGTFYTNMTGKYWYSSYKIPLKFSKSGKVKDGKVDMVYMPLNSPWTEVEPFAFVRGKCGQVKAKGSSSKYVCSNRGSSTYHKEYYALVLSAILVINSLLIQ